MPWREEVSAYRTVVSELMCQQTQIATVIPYFERWTAKWPDFKDLAKADEAEVLAMWAGLGYYSRARNLLALATSAEHDTDLGFAIAHRTRHICANLWVVNTFS